MTHTSPDATPALAEPSPVAEAPAKLCRHDRIKVRESGVHGRGVYAVVAIACGKEIIECRGEHITRKEALRHHPHDPSDPNHTFYFSLEDDSVIDAKYGSNRARWINHACKPDYEAREADGHMSIHALHDIKIDEELFYDYGLVIESRQTRTLREQFARRCSAKKCRGTILAPPGKTKKKQVKRSSFR